MQFRAQHQQHRDRVQRNLSNSRYKKNNDRTSTLRPQIQSLWVAVAGKSALIEEKSAKSDFIVPAQEVGGRGEGVKSENWPMAEIQYDRRFIYTNILVGNASENRNGHGADLSVLTTRRNFTFVRILC